MDRPGISFTIIDWARHYHLLPESYLYGHAFVFHDAQMRVAFLNGDRQLTGWWWFFPYCLAVKTPLALFGLLILAAGAVIWRWRRGGAAAASAGERGPALTPALSHGERGRTWWAKLRGGVYGAAPLWVLLVIYWAVSLASHLNIGQRHILPTYPAMFILAGGAGYWLADRRWPAIIALVALVAWFVGASLWVRPHYLAYFNELIGPRNAYKHLVDSSLDWGQDLPGLKKYLVDHGLDPPGKTKVYLSYFGTANLEYHQVHAQVLECFFGIPDPQDALRIADAPTGGCYCISATMLQAPYLHFPGVWNRDYEGAYQQLSHNFDQLRRQMGDPAQAEDIRTRLRTQLIWANMCYRDLCLGRLCAYLRHREPDDEVGYSILIYNLSDGEVAKALHGEPAELGTPELRPPSNP
jgi:hypothetical protein